MTPRALLVDFGGTLDAPRHWLDRFVEHYRAAGIEIERAALDPAYSYATAAGYQRWRELEQYGLDDLVGFLLGIQLERLAESVDRKLLTSLGASSGARQELARMIRLRFVEESRTGMERSREVIRALHDRYRIGVVSNFYGNLRAVLDEAGMAGLIDAAVDSSAAGVFKPDAGIFMIALRALGVTGAEAAMVGDSLEKDCAPAHRLGMRTVWFKWADAAQAELEGTPPDYIIRALAELNNLTW
ncbi:MAG: HAD family hydrolase [Candidatus Binataceae bacterium]